MNILTIQNRVVSLSSGLGKLVGKRTSEALIMTRILSAFKFLKRVGFAVLVLGGSITALGQPYSPVWNYEFGESGPDVVNDIIKTSDGNILLAIKSQPDTLETGWAALVKLDPDGNLVWRHEYRADSMDLVKAVLEVEDGGNMLVGSGVAYWQSQYILKTDSQGNFQWSRYHNIHPGDWFVDGMRLTNGQYLLMTTGGSSNFPDAMLCWVNPFGQIVRNIWYGGNGHDLTSEIGAVSNNEFVFAMARSDSTYHTLQPLVERIDSVGELVWSRSMGTEESEWVNTMTTTEDGGCIFAGCRDSYLHDPQASPYAAAVSPNGDSLWMHIWAEQEGCIFRCRRVGENYILIGNTRSEESGTQSILIIKVTAQGERLWTQVFDTGTAEQAYALCEVSDEAFVVGGWRWNGATTGWDAYVTRFEANTSISENAEQKVPGAFDLNISPNPFNSYATIMFSLSRPGYADISLYDLLGRKVKVILGETMQSGVNTVQLDVAGLASGIYLVRLQSKTTVLAKKIVVLK